MIPPNMYLEIKQISNTNDKKLRLFEKQMWECIHEGGKETNQIFGAYIN